MIEQIKVKEEILYLIKEIESCPLITQRGLSTKLGISLGKTNYLLRELTKNGFIEIEHTPDYSRKIKKVKYLITPKGTEEKTRLTHLFFKIKKQDYEQFIKEYNHLAGIK